MKVIQIDSIGGPEVMQLREIETPAPAAGEVLVKLRACGVNYKDTYIRKGIYPSKLPAVLGEEGAGEVSLLGSGVRGFKPGEPVAFSSVAGAYAEYISVPVARLIKLPKGIDFQLGAAILLQGMTAHYLVNSTYPLSKGETCIVHAAAGGVGLLLVQLAKRKGARVIATVSTEEKKRLALEAGADRVVLYSSEDFAAVSREVTAGKGVDVVYDSVGRDTFDKSLSSLKTRGYLVLFGHSSGKVPDFDPTLLSRKGSLYLTRPVLDHYIEDRKSLEWRANEILDLVASRKLSVRIGATFPLADAQEAHRQLEGRKTTGKVLLIP